MKNEKTPFETTLQAIEEKRLSAPVVSYEGSEVNYIRYQLATHKFNLSLMAKGMTFRGIKFTDIKKYYGLKGRTAADCLPQFMEIFDTYCK